MPRATSILHLLIWICFVGALWGLEKCSKCCQTLPPSCWQEQCAILAMKEKRISHPCTPTHQVPQIRDKRLRAWKAQIRSWSIPIVKHALASQVPFIASLICFPTELCACWKQNDKYWRLSTKERKLHSASKDNVEKHYAFNMLRQAFVFTEGKQATFLTEMNVVMYFRICQKLCFLQNFQSLQSFICWITLSALMKMNTAVIRLFTAETFCILLNYSNCL